MFLKTQNLTGSMFFCNMIFMFFQIVVIIWRYKGKPKSQHLAPTYIALQTSIQQKTWHLPA